MSFSKTTYTLVNQAQIKREKEFFSSFVSTWWIIQIRFQREKNDDNLKISTLFLKEQGKWPTVQERDLGLPLGYLVILNLSLMEF